MRYSIIPHINSAVHSFPTDNIIDHYEESILSQETKELAHERDAQVVNIACSLL